MDDLRTQHIRTLDDHLQKNPTSDIAIMTPRIAALGREAFDRIMKTITAMADICHDYEPDEDRHTGRAVLVLLASLIFACTSSNPASSTPPAGGAGQAGMASNTAGSTQAAGTGGAAAGNTTSSRFRV